MIFTLLCHIQENLQNIQRKQFAAIVRQFLWQWCYAVKHVDSLGAFSVCHGYRSGTQANASHLYGECNRDLSQRVNCVINTDRHFVSCPYLSACHFAFILSNNNFLYKIVISFQVNSCSIYLFPPDTRISMEWVTSYLTTLCRMRRLRLKWGSYYELWLDNDGQNFKMLFQDSILETKEKPRIFFSRHRVFEPRLEPGIAYYEFRNATRCAAPWTYSRHLLKENCKSWQISHLGRQSVHVTRHVIIAVQQHTMPVCCWSLLQWVVNQTVMSYHSWVTEGNWTIVTDRSVMCIALTLANCVQINERYATFVSDLTHVVFSQDSCGSFIRGI